MNYVFNYKKKVLEVAKCRHCKHFTWYENSTFFGFCIYYREKRSNSQLACGHEEIKEWLLPPKPVVQLNLFKDEKSV